MTVSFYTLGCKVNQYETQSLMRLFEQRGYSVRSTAETADVFVINSCTVTAESDRKTRQTVRHFKKKMPQSVIVLMGCMPQAFPNAAAELLDADIVVGNVDVSVIPDLVEKFLKDKKRTVRISEHKNGECFSTPTIESFEGRTRAFLKIEDGCNRFCSYCIIPYSRGRVRSKSLDEIKSETEILSRAGYSEIVLVGINLSAYGNEQENGFNICDAVDVASKPKGIKRVRLGSLEPDHISDEMLARLKNNEKFCPQFHLSLQSGCDDTLKRMNRHYDSAFYYDLVTRIRNIFPNAAITTDVMVGFVGEDEREFNESLEFVKKVGFAKAHVFAYSRREGTRAYSMENQVLKAVKEKRSAAMIAATTDTEYEFLKNMVGQTVSVLFETVKGGFYEGYTENYSRVLVKSKKDIRSLIVPVRIIGAEKEHLVAELV